MAIKLIALDLDGTLLDDTLVIYPQTKSVIKQAQERGIIVTLATGRMTPAASYYANVLSLNHPLVVYNGALIVDPIKNEVVYENTIPIALMKEIIKYCKLNSLYLQFYNDNKIVVEKLTEDTRIDPDLLHASCEEVKDFLSYSIKPSPKMMIVSKPAKTLDIQRDLRRLFGDSLDFVLSKPYLLEILKKGASKATALQFLSDYFGILQEEVLAIGDSENDESMVEWAGIGVSVFNGSIRLKTLADYCTTAPYSLGVEEAIRHFVLEKNKLVFEEN